MVGEIGGDAEEQLAEYIVRTSFGKPVIAYIAGRAAPKEKRMVSNYARADVPVAKRPAEVPALLAKKLKR